MSSQLILIRHGESEANVGLSKDPNSRLTDRGLQQARDLGARLAGIDLSRFQCIASPYERTRRTADEIANAAGLVFSPQDRVREWGDAATVGGKQYHKESAEELIARLREFLREHRDRDLLIVSHAAPIAVLTQLAWGETPNTDGAFWNGVTNCCLRWLRRTDL